MKKEKGKNDSFEGDWSMRSGLRRRLGFRVGDDVFQGSAFEIGICIGGKKRGQERDFFSPDNSRRRKEIPRSKFSRNYETIISVRRG